MQRTAMFDPQIASGSLPGHPQERPRCLRETEGSSRQPLEMPRRSQMRGSLAPVQRNAMPIALARAPAVISKSPLWGGLGGGWGGGGAMSSRDDSP